MRWIVLGAFIAIVAVFANPPSAGSWGLSQVLTITDDSDDGSDGQLFVQIAGAGGVTTNFNGEGTILTITGGGGSCPAGGANEIQFYSGGSCGADSDFTWDAADEYLQIGGSTASAHIELADSNGFVLYLETDDGAMKDSTKAAIVTGLGDNNTALMLQSGTGAGDDVYIRSNDDVIFQTQNGGTNLGAFSNSGALYAYGANIQIGNNTDQNLLITFDLLSADETIGWNEVADQFEVTHHFTVGGELEVANFNPLKLYETGSTEYIGHRAATTITTNAIVEWSDDIDDAGCNAGEVLEVASVTTGPPDIIAIECDTDDSGGSPTWDSIADPTNNGLQTITFDNNERSLFTSDLDNASFENFFWMRNTDADLANTTTLLRLGFDDDAGNEGYFIRAYADEDSGVVERFSVDLDGDVYLGGLTGPAVLYIDSNEIIGADASNFWYDTVNNALIMDSTSYIAGGDAASDDLYFQANTSAVSNGGQFIFGGNYGGNLTIGNFAIYRFDTTSLNFSTTGVDWILHLLEGDNTVVVNSQTSTVTGYSFGTDFSNNMDWVMSLSSGTTVTGPDIYGFKFAPELKADSSVTRLTAANMVGFDAVSYLDNGTLEEVQVTQYYGFRDAPAGINTLTDYFNRTGFLFADTTGAGQGNGGSTYIIGLDFADQTGVAASTNLISFRNRDVDAEMWHYGPATFGADQSPTSGYVIDAQGKILATDNVEIDNEKLLVLYEADGNGTNYVAHKAPNAHGATNTTVVWMDATADSCIAGDVIEVASFSAGTLTLECDVDGGGGGGFAPILGFHTIGDYTGNGGVPIYLGVGTADSDEDRAQTVLSQTASFNNLRCVTDETNPSTNIVITGRHGTCGSLANDTDEGGDGVLSCTITTGVDNCESTNEMDVDDTAPRCLSLSLDTTGDLSTNVTVSCTMERSG
jgi:hypothetical protein